MQPQQLNPTIANLARAIRQTESGGNYQAVGKSGEYGAFQFTEPTWNAASKAFGVNVPLKQASQLQQNEVAYKQLESWSKAHPEWNVGNYASAWNAGEKHADAYLENYTGTNASGVKYDTGAYAKSVATAYQQIKQGQNVGIDPNNPSSVGATPQPEKSPSVGGFIGNVFGSAGNLVSSVAHIAAHPIDTVENLGGTALGGVESVFGANNENTQKFDKVIDYFKNRYGGDSLSHVINNIGKTLYTDPVGAALDLSTLVDGLGGAIGAIGGISDTARAADLAKASDFIATAKGLVSGDSAEAASALKTQGTASKIGSTLKSIGEYTNPLSLAGKGLSAVGGSAVKGISQTLGFTSGAGSGATMGAYDAGAAGGEAADAFKAAQKGGIESVDSVVDTAKEAFQSLKDQRQADYQSQLQGIRDSGQVIDPKVMQPIYDQFDQLLKKFDVVRDSKGNLDFSNSYLESEPGSMTDVKQLDKKIQQFKEGGIDVNPVTLDKFKQNISDRYTGGSRGSAFTQPLVKSVRQVLNKNVDGYEKLTSGYHAASEELNDITKSLSIGGKAAKETVLKKLTSALSDKNPYRADILKALEEKSGVDIRSQAAGAALSRIGISLDIKTAVEVLGVLFSGNHKFLLGLVASSPKIVGNFMFALGRGNAIIESAAKIIAAAHGDTVFKALTEANQTQKK